jgi:UDP-N-acetylglucosamine 4,6-dehydratase
MTLDFLDGRSILVTGGTGSFGKAFVKSILDETRARRVVVFSRDELKQYEMQQLYPGEERVRFFIGDVRDSRRLNRAFEDVDVVIHAAALKHITAAEYNPIEAVRTNIHGAENVIDAAIDNGVERVIALSTDKASSPINLYGATKLVSDKLFVAGNAYVGRRKTRMSVVRYGNVVGSRGSVVPHFQKLAESGTLPITDTRMTRFWITLAQGVRFVRDSLDRMRGGEIFVPKLPSMKIVDLAAAIVPQAEVEVIGIRPGEKLHEEMISVTDARHAVDAGNYYVVEPEMEWWPQDEPYGEALAEGFSYRSDSNDWWLSVDELKAILEEA